MNGDDFLGRGIAFPPTTDETGAMKMSAGENDIEQSIRIILSTAPGERVMRPTFGCGIHDRVFSTLDTTTRSLIAGDVEDALVEWEPRIEVLDVSVSERADEDGRLPITIDYRVRSTNAADNLVYPFYVGEH